MTSESAVGGKNIIQDVEKLDLTAMSAEDLANVEAIKNVEILVIPESLMGTLSNVATENIEHIVPVPDGKKVEVRTINGPVQMGGGSLAHEDDDHFTLMIINGPLVFTSPVTSSKGHQLIVNGPVFAPHGSDDALGAAMRELNGPLIFYSGEGEFKIHAGQAKLNASALVNEGGNPDDKLLVAGQMLITDQTDSVGYKQIYVAGQAFIPRENQALLSSRLQVYGQIIWYSGVPRVVNGHEEFSGAFFEYLDEPVTLIVNGMAKFQEDVSIEAVRDKVTEIVLNGVIEGPSHLLPLLQARTKEKNGEIRELDSGQEAKE